MTASDRCATRYPILLLHGMGFHDRLPIHYYWGRIPRCLRKGGARVYFGDQDGNAAIEENARDLVPVIERILQETGAEKLNIIAHSKGGLEARYLAGTLGMAPRIASLTTLSTPHNGSVTVDVLLRHFASLIRFGCVFADLNRRILGDRHPATYRAVTQFTTDYMQRFNAAHPVPEGVFCQSFAFVMEHWYRDLFMAFPYTVVRAFEGDNDGLLTPRNAAWVNFRGTYRSAGRLRGISHPDVSNYLLLPFARHDGDHRIGDMAAFYVRIAEDLKARGL
ncbi:MAG: alpha/beta fold hydrolase [Oscillospiraceae bacterium]|nr:alpha/beta fold hydrolase [Oscillospiraceae bacterium]